MADGTLAPTVIFERHPASIERHTAPEPGGAGAFDGITTWSPYLLTDGTEASPADAPPPPTVSARQDPPPGYRPPPVPVRPVADVRPEPVGPVPEPEPPATPADPGVAEAVAEPSDTTVADRDVAAVPSPFAPPPPAPLPPAPLPPPPASPPQQAFLAWPGSPPLLRPSAPDEATGFSLWDSDPAPRSLTRRAQTRPAMRPRLAMGLGLAAVLAGLVLAGLRYGPALLAPGPGVTAVFNAPMMVVRSAAAGRVVTVTATAAQVVEPQSALLTIHTDDRSQDRPVLAGVHGMIRSVETVPGAALVAGAPLVRLQDCDRAFLTVPPGAKLQAGQHVQVKLPDQKPVAGTVRASAGVMEPPDSLVVGLEPGTMTAACPVGRSVMITPIQG